MNRPVLVVLLLGVSHLVACGPDRRRAGTELPPKSGPRAETGATWGGSNGSGAGVTIQFIVKYVGGQDDPANFLVAPGGDGVAAASLLRDEWHYPTDPNVNRTCEESDPGDAASNYFRCEDQNDIELWVEQLNSSKPSQRILAGEITLDCGLRVYPRS